VQPLDLHDTSRPPLAELNSSGIPISAGQVHKVWRGLVQAPGCLESCQPVVFKWMSGQHKLPIELACSLAGVALGLAVPRGVVVLAKRDQMPGLPAGAKPLPGTDDYLCFGSVHQWPDDNFVRLLDDAGNEEYVWRRLCDTAGAAPGAAWDELAANADRHIRNLVFDGSKFWFIDHDKALEPVAAVMRNFAVKAARNRVLEHRAESNRVASQLASRRPRDHGMLDQPARFARAENSLRLLADQVRAWSTGRRHVDDVWPLTEVVLRGIVLRLPALSLMLNERLALPEAGSLWNSSNRTK
jgi:hypothetical protein